MLIEHHVITLAKKGSPVNVILGSNSNHIIRAIRKYNMNIIVNEHGIKGWAIPD